MRLVALYKCYMRLPFAFLFCVNGFDGVRFVNTRTGLDWLGQHLDGLNWTGSGKNGPMSHSGF